MKNRLIDVHNNLMATLEDLDDPDLLDNPDKLKRLCELAKTKSQVANSIVSIGELGLNALKHDAEFGGISGANNLLLTEN